MENKLFLLATLLFAAVPAGAVAQSSGVAPALYEDVQNGIAVRFGFAPGAIEFSAELPAGWTFSIELDGDQNGIWGHGPETPDARWGTSRDLRFTQSSPSRRFCAQKILTTVPERPDDIYSSTECSSRAERGGVTSTPPDGRGRVTITYSIPLMEVFGTRREAHLRACVWNGRRWTCQRSIGNLFVLRNPDAGTGN